MYGMRIRIVHDCFEIDLDVVWQTIQRDLPELRPRIVRLLALGLRDLSVRCAAKRRFLTAILAVKSIRAQRMTLAARVGYGAGESRTTRNPNVKRRSVAIIFCRNAGRVPAAIADQP